MREPFSMKHGQTGRLIFNVTAAEGTDKTLMGAVMVDGHAVALMAEGNDLLIPVLAPGVYLMEVRCGGASVLYGELEVLPSPLGLEAGAVAWSVDVDLSEPLAVVNVVLNEGPRGAKGEDGRDGVSYDEVAAMIYDEEETTRSTPEGTDKSNFRFIELTAAHVPAGDLRRIAIRLPNNLKDENHGTVYLGLWERDGADTEWVRVGASREAVEITANVDNVWEFDGVKLSGRKLRITALDAPDARWQDTFTLRAKVSACTDGSVIMGTNGARQNYIPQMQITVSNAVAKYAPAGHVDDEVVHVTAEEREAWNAGGLTEAQAAVLGWFEHDASYGLSLVHKTGGTTDNRVRMMMSSTGCNLVTGGTLGIQSPLVVTMTRTGYACYTESSTGASYNFYGHTLSDTEMAPYGITEACVWMGDPALPLNLRGSTVKVNGVALAEMLSVASGGGMGMFIARIETADSAPSSMVEKAIADGAAYATWLPRWDMYGQMVLDGDVSVVSEILVIGLSEPGENMNAYAAGCAVVWSVNKIA